MKFIKRVELKNFQSHKDSSLDLDPYLNVIVGPSDSGKSSIIRGIKWVLFNEPSGNFFIREGESEASVKLYLSDGSSVTRYRSKSKNSYIINYSSGDELVLNGFGVNVPEEVEALTGVSKIPFDQGNSEIINISDQLDGPFLLSEKNSTKAFVIGGLAGVDVVDDSISDLLKELRNLNIEKKRVDEDLDNINTQLESFTSLEDDKKLYEELEIVYREISNREARLEDLRHKQVSYGLLVGEKIKLDQLLTKLGDLNRLNGIYLDLYEKIALYKVYRRLGQQFIQVARDKKYSIEVLQAFNDLDLARDIREGVEGSIERYNLLVNTRKTYEGFIRDKSSLDKHLLDKEVMESLESLVGNLNNKIGLSLEMKLKSDQLEDVGRRLSIGREYVRKFEHMDNLLNLDKKAHIYLDRYNSIRKIKNQLINVNLEKNIIKKEMNLRKKEVDLKVAKYKDILADSKVCPTCFSKIDETIVENIVKEFNK